jgi:hypothetical protein
VGFGELVAQEAEARHLDREAERRRRDVEHVNDQHVTWFGTLDVHGTRQRMHGTEIGVRHILDRRIGPELAVERVTRVRDHLVARRTAHDGRDVRMPAVVALVGFTGEWDRVVDADLVGCHRCLAGRCHRRFLPATAPQ